MSIKIKIDTTVDAAYITLSENAVVRTVEFGEDLMIDVDEYGVAVGVEVLGQSTPIPFRELCDQFHVHSDVVELLRLIRPNLESFLNVATAHDGTATAAKRSLAAAAH